MTPPTTIMMSGTSLRGKLGLEFGHQRQMSGGKRRHADDVDVVLDRLAGAFRRRRKQRADVHVEAEIGKGRGDHLLAAIMAVLADLGDQNPGAAAVVSLEGGGHSQGAAHSVIHLPDLLPVNARHGAGIDAVPAERLLHGVRKSRRPWPSPAPP